MTSKEGRRAARTVAAVALALAACTPRATDVTEPSADAAARDAAADDARGDAKRRCGVGGTTATEPVTVACAQPTPARLVLDRDNVYWTVQSGGPVVMKAPLAGGAPVLLVYDSAAAVGLAVDSTSVYYTQPSLGRVMRLPLLGGPPVALATKLDAPTFLAVADGALYWTGGRRGAGVIMKLALAPGAVPVTLLDGQTAPRALAVLHGFVYWTDFVDGTLLRIPTTSPPPSETGDAGVRTATRLASGLRGPGDLALARGYAYLPDQAGRLARVTLDGGTVETVVDVRGIPFGLATDGVSLYWSTLGDGGIFKTSLEPGGSVSTIVAREPDPHFVAVGDVAVYWGTWGEGGAIKKTAK